MRKIRRATINDVNSIVDIHLEAFKDFFLTSLGRDFLLFYYKCFIRSNETVTLVAESENAIVGFSASTAKCRGFNGRLIKNNLWNFFVLSIRLLFISPKALVRLALNLTKKSDNVKDDEEYAELYSIGVLPDGQRKGVGGALIADTLDYLREMGVSQVSLTTDYDNNEDAVTFYRNRGFETLYEFVTYPQRRMYRLIKRI